MSARGNGFGLITFGFKDNQELEIALSVFYLILKIQMTPDK